MRENPLVSGEAAAWAKAEMLRRCRGFVSVLGTTNGTPDMVVARLSQLRDELGLTGVIIESNVGGRIPLERHPMTGI